MTGYDTRGRPQPCRKCRGTGRIAPASPQRPAPPTRDRWIAAHERAIERYGRTFAALALTPQGAAELIREMEAPPADTPERRATFARARAATRFVRAEAPSGPHPIPDLLP